MKYFIITGTSRGLGKAIVNELIAPGHMVFGISRSDQHFAANSGQFMAFKGDLRQAAALEKLMQRIFAQMDLSRAEAVYLVNNASMIAPATFIDGAGVNDITLHLHLNLLAPIVLTSLFIQQTGSFAGIKRVLNISSASAKYHLAGMSLYSASKAGLDVFSQCAALEQQHKEAPVQIASVWPGMIDTRLQQEARELDQASFPAAKLFADAQAAGMLAAPEQAARRLVRVMLQEQFEHGAIIDLSGGTYSS